jgi:hypothetical protein
MDGQAKNRDNSGMGDEPAMRPVDLSRKLPWNQDSRLFSSG